MIPFISATTPPEVQDVLAWWFVFKGNKLLVHTTAAGVAIPALPNLAKLGLVPIRTQYLGKLAGQHCYAAELTTAVEPPPTYEFSGLRQLFGQLDESFTHLAARALQIIDWDRNHQFCSRCATPFEATTDRAKLCPRCGLRTYPRISPAVIMRIQRDNTILLAHATRQPTGFYSVLAGFVEPGETLEATVAREIYEEVGLTVKNIRYFGSQPWPFPDSLMIGFMCDYAAGEIRVEPEEIADAAWYTAAQVRQMLTPPANISIAGQLIQAFLNA